MNTPQFDSIENIKRFHKGHWFTPNTMRFFKSKVYPTVIFQNGKYWFISSERNYPQPRRYTIRNMTPDGAIDTHGEFQAYASKKQAERALAKELGLTTFFA